MQIKYTEFVPNPALRNTTAHLPAHICQNLIAQGVAVHVPYKNYVEFLDAEHREGKDASNADAGYIKGTIWEFSTTISKRPVILRKSGSEVARFESLTFWANGNEYQIEELKSCPLSVKQAFVDALAAIDPAHAEAARERVERERYNVEAENKKGTNRFFRKLGLDV